MMADEFQNNSRHLIAEVKSIFTEGNYVEVFGFLQFVLRHEDCPYGFADEIDQALVDGQAAYRILEELTIVPISSEEDRKTLESALIDTATTEFRGARSHLHLAGSYVTTGDYSSAVRESIHAVESVARTLKPSGSLSEALAQLERSSGIHAALKNGFKSIYGYMSDEQGIRHPLLDCSHPKVDEADALFMLGACASFVSYMINKARDAGLLAK